MPRAKRRRWKWISSWCAAATTRWSWSSFGISPIASALNGRCIPISRSWKRKFSERTREIEETKQYLENLLENANDVIYTLDSEQCFTYVNSKVLAWGYAKEDLLGRPYLASVVKAASGPPVEIHSGYRRQTSL